jgi:hypothetical protein
MKRIALLFVTFAIVCGQSVAAQNKAHNKTWWGGVELSVAPAIVDVNCNYDELESDNYTTINFGVVATGGVWLSPGFSVGLGSGISYLDGIRVLSLPVLGELKYSYPLRRRDNIDGFVYGRGGCAFPLGHNKGNGVVAGAGWGLAFGDRQEMKYTVSVGYSLTHLDYRTRSNRSEIPSRHAIEFKVGVLW